MNVAIIALVVAATVLFLLRRVGTISGAEAKKLVSSGAMLIDVRSPSEFSSGHIKGAVNIPVDRIPERSKKIGDKSKSIVVYCRSGARSARAKRILQGEGFDNVSNLGGMHRWR